MTSQLADYSKANVSEVILKLSKLGGVNILRIWLQSSVLSSNNRVSLACSLNPGIDFFTLVMKALDELFFQYDCFIYIENL